MEEVELKELKKDSEYRVLKTVLIDEYDCSGPSWSHDQRTLKIPEEVYAFGKNWRRRQIPLGAGEWYSVYYIIE